MKKTLLEEVIHVIECLNLQRFVSDDVANLIHKNVHILGQLVSDRYSNGFGDCFKGP